MLFRCQDVCKTKSLTYISITLESIYRKIFFNLAKMANIEIPSVHLPGIKSISELSEEQIQGVYEFLRKQTNGIGVSKFISFFSKELKDEGIGGAIYSFGQLLAYRNSDIKEISHNLTESYQELAEDQLSPEQRKKLEDRLYNILSLSNFLIISNEAYHIVSNYNSILRTNLSTDVRLLFSDNDYKKKNALLLHKLFVRFKFKGEADSEIFYLDNEDLIELKSQIEESLENEENIRKSNEGILDFIELS